MLTHEVTQLPPGGESLPSHCDEVATRLSVYGPWIAPAVAAAIVLGPQVVEYGQQLWRLDHYQFYPLLLAAVAWLGWQRACKMRFRYSSPQSVTLRLALWLLSISTAALSVLINSPLIAAVSFLILILAGLYEWGGWSTLKHFFPVWAVLLLGIRAPFNWDQQAIVTLQRVATDWASGALDLLGVRHLADGVVIRLPERDFFIEEACSGIHSLFATTAFLAVFAVLSRRGLVRFLFLFLATLFWVLAANALRVVAVVVLSTRYGLPVTDGPGHELLGVSIFALVILLILSTDRLLLFVIPQRQEFTHSYLGDSEQLVARVGGYVTGRSKARSLVPLAAVTVAFVMIGAGAFASSSKIQPVAPLFAPTAGMAQLPESALPESWEGWTRVGFEVREREEGDPAGEISRIWYYRKDGVTAAASIDGPFHNWHDTEVCYEALGYTTRSRRDHPVVDDDGSKSGFTELSIAGSRGDYGHVLFMAYSDKGEPLRPPARRTISIGSVVADLRDRLINRDEPTAKRIYQVQLFTKSGLDVTASEEAELERLFHFVRTEIAKAMRMAASSSS